MYYIYLDIYQLNWGWLKSNNKRELNLWLQKELKRPLIIIPMLLSWPSFWIINPSLRQNISNYLESMEWENALSLAMQSHQTMFFLWKKQRLHNVLWSELLFPLQSTPWVRAIQISEKNGIISELWPISYKVTMIQKEHLRSLKKNLYKGIYQSLAATILIILSVQQNIIKIPDEILEYSYPLFCFLMLIIKVPTNPYQDVLPQLHLIHVFLNNRTPIQQALIESALICKFPTKFRDHVTSSLKKGKPLYNIIREEPSLPKKIRELLFKSLQQGTIQKDLPQITQLCLSLKINHQKKHHWIMIICLNIYCLSILFIVIIFGYIPYVQNMAKLIP